MSDTISSPIILTDDFNLRDEWSRPMRIFSKGDAVYCGKEEGEYIVIGMPDSRIHIPKSMTKKPDLQCQGWEGPCERTDAWKGHMNTRYEDEERNYTTLCPECWKACHEYWEGMWEDYYSNCM